MASADLPDRSIHRLTAVAVAALAIVSAAAWAQSDESSERTQTGGPTAPAAATPSTSALGIGWNVNLGASLQETFTDNGNQGNGNQGSGNGRQQTLTTSVMPYINITGDTPRTQMNFSYQPSFNYATNSNPNFTMYHNANGRLHTTVVEDLFYIDAYAYASVVPQYAGFQNRPLLVGPDGQPLPTGNGGFSQGSLTQYYSFSVSPTLSRTFGGTGTATAYATLSESGTNSPNYRNTQNGFQNINGTGRTSTLSGSASFTTGEDLGRFQDSVRISASQSSGTGVSSRASSIDARNTISYAVTRWATVMGQIGYQKYSFPSGVTVTNSQTSNTGQRFGVESVVWNVAARFIPNADSQITIGYGRLYGGNQWNLDAYYQVTARTSIYANAGTSLGTGIGQAQSNLFAGGGTQPGPPPVGTGFLPGTQNIYRTQSITIGASTIQERDSYTLYVSASDQKVVATVINSDSTSPTPPPVQGSSRNLALNGSWNHQFSEVMNGGIYATFGVSKATDTASSTDYFATFAANLTYLFSPTLSGSARYYLYDLISQTPNRSYLQNVFVLSLTKQF